MVREGMGQLQVEELLAARPLRTRRRSLLSFRPAGTSGGEVPPGSVTGITACADQRYNHRAVLERRESSHDACVCGSIGIPEQGTDMANEQFDRLASFREFIQRAEARATIPPVAESDLKMLHQVCLEMTKRDSGKDGVVSLDVMARACNRDANLPAVWLRHKELRLMARHGLLAAWQHGTALDDAVFHLAATVPMRGVCFDREEFVKRLRGATVPQIPG